MLPLCLGVPGGVSDSAVPVSETHVAACHIAEFGVYNALSEVASRAHVAIGVEAVGNYKTEPRINIDFPGGSVRDLLDMILSQAPEYRWTEHDGIIHVLWHGANLPVADIEMHYPGVDEKTVKEIWEDLGRRPELKAWLESNRCSRQEIITRAQLYTPGARSPRRERRISISAGSTTLAHLLDQVAVKSREDFWAIVQSPPGQPCQVSIFCGE